MDRRVRGGISVQYVLGCERVGCIGRYGLCIFAGSVAMVERLVWACWVGRSCSVCNSLYIPLTRESLVYPPLILSWVNARLVFYPAIDLSKLFGVWKYRLSNFS